MLIRPISKIAFKRSLVTCVGAESEQTHEHDLSVYNEHTHEWMNEEILLWITEIMIKKLNQ